MLEGRPVANDGDDDVEGRFGDGGEIAADVADDVGGLWGREGFVRR